MALPEEVRLDIEYVRKLIKHPLTFSTLCDFVFNAHEYYDAFEGYISTSSYKEDLLHEREVVNYLLETYEEKR